MKAATQDVIDDIVFAKNQVFFALDDLKHKKADQAEDRLHRVDQVLAALLNTVKAAKL